MPTLSCYVDDRTLAILTRESAERGQTPEQLAEAAIENAAIEALRCWPKAEREALKP